MESTQKRTSNSRLLCRQIEFSKEASSPWDIVLELDEFIDRQRKLDWANSTYVYHFFGTSLENDFFKARHLFGREVIGHMNLGTKDLFELRDFKERPVWVFKLAIENGIDWESIWRKEQEVRMSHPGLDPQWRLILEIEGPDSKFNDNLSMLFFTKIA